jgi:protein SCO1/2
MKTDEPVRTESGGWNDPVRRSRARRLAVISLALSVVLAAVLGAVIALVTHHNSGSATLPASFGDAHDIAIPSRIANLPLFDATGSRRDLGQLRGKIVVLSDFLTSCQEECPISVGALSQTAALLEQAHLGKDVVVVDVSVDPGRDTAQRLLAYERYTGLHLDLWSGSDSRIATFWKFFGVSYNKVAEDDPPGIDWQTGKPYRYDVDHSNDVYIIDATGHERVLTLGLPNLHGKLSPKLQALLDDLGRHNLAHPGFGAWTVTDLVHAVSFVLGRPIPVS